MSASKCGKTLALGENNCKHPEMVVLDISNATKSSVLVRMKGHRFGMALLLFSPWDNYLVSVGTSEDNGLFVHRTSDYQRVSQNKLSRSVESIAMDSQ